MGATFHRPAGAEVAVVTMYNKWPHQATSGRIWISRSVLCPTRSVCGSVPSATTQFVVRMRFKHPAPRQRSHVVEAAERGAGGTAIPGSLPGGRMRSRARNNRPDVMPQTGVQGGARSVERPPPTSTRGASKRRSSSSRNCRRLGVNAFARRHSIRRALRPFFAPSTVCGSALARLLCCAARARIVEERAGRACTTALSVRRGSHSTARPTRLFSQSRSR
eukprot:364597-Chlamydomonas_euryale.AAC.3